MKPLTLTFRGAGEAVLVLQALHAVYVRVLDAVEAAQATELTAFEATGARQVAVQAAARRDHYAALIVQAQAELDAEDADDPGCRGGAPAAEAHGCAALAPAVGPAPTSSNGGAKGAPPPSSDASSPANLLSRPARQALPAAGDFDHAQSQPGGQRHG
jgi:hypothetical protein